MLGSGFPPALPWPTGRRVWVGPLQNCLEPAPQTHSPSLFHSPLLSLTLLLPCSLLSLTRSPLHVHTFHNLYPTSSRTNPLCHSYIFTLKLSLLLCLTLARSCCHALACHQLTPASSTQSHANMQTCSQARPHTLRQTRSHGLHSLPLPSPPPSPPQYSLSTADVMLANTFHFLVIHSECTGLRVLLA